MRLDVLLVEDEPDARELLCRALERAGHGCTAVPSLAAARRRIEEGLPIDVAVVDLVFAGEAGSGLDLLAPLRACAPSAAIVMMTAFADLERVRRALNEGASYFLDKPFRSADLVAIVERLAHGERERFAMTIDAAMARAGLTSKERAITRLLFKGMSSAEIAGVEGNSEKTVRQHVSAIYAKFGVSSRAELFHLVFPS